MKLSTKRWFSRSLTIPALPSAQKELCKKWGGPSSSLLQGGRERLSNQSEKYDGEPLRVAAVAVCQYKEGVRGILRIFPRLQVVNCEQ